MFDFLFALHLLFAIFTIGPLIHGAVIGSIGMRQADSAATTSASRILEMYSFATAVVVIVGMGLMSGRGGEDKVASINDVWIWLSSLLWLVAVILVLGWLVPALDKATKLIDQKESAVALTSRVTAVGGAVAVIFAVITVLMIYKPGK